MLYDRERDDREAIAREIAAKRGAVLVPPYDDPLVIAGQGTAGREIVEDLAALGLTPDVVVVTASGGGLTAGHRACGQGARAAGAALYRRAARASTTTRARSAAGERETQRRAHRHHLRCADGAARRASSPSRSTARWSAQGVPASDEEVAAAVAFAFRELKLVVEPGGAVALAALLTGKIDVKGKIAVAVLSGGNVDPELFYRLVA